MRNSEYHQRFLHSNEIVDKGNPAVFPPEDLLGASFLRGSAEGESAETDLAELKQKREEKKRKAQKVGGVFELIRNKCQHIFRIFGRRFRVIF